jgi:hypothetical protein
MRQTRALHEAIADLARDDAIRPAGGDVISVAEPQLSSTPKCSSLSGHREP